MVTAALTVILAILSGLLIGFVARTVLSTPAGWPRSIIVGLAVFATGLPFATWMLDQTGLLTDGEVIDAPAAFAALAVVMLSTGWVFALGLALLVAIETIFPTRHLQNPIDMVRAAIKQRKRTRRYLQIIGIASRHGAGWLVEGRSRVRQDLTTSEQRARAVIATINDSGVTFVKLGQVLSTRRDLVPEPYLSALATLQSEATTLPWDDIRSVIETGLEAPIDTVFRSINPEPLAAASVAQVHEGVLHDGSVVVVKVQRPAARAQVEADADIIVRLAERAETHTRFGRDLNLAAVARSFTATLLDELDELDYRVEATNLEMIRHTLKEQPNHPERLQIVVPKVYPKASGARVLTMDLVAGQPLSRASARIADMQRSERESLARGLMEIVLEQILVHGVFHADLHPGNVILRPDGSLGLIDFGAVGVIERSRRQRLTAVMLAAISEDDIAATEALLLIVDVPDDANVDSLRHDVGIVITTERHRPRGNGSIFTRLLDVIRQHRIALPGDLAAAFRSFATLEGCLKTLDPDFDMFDQALPMVPKLLRRSHSLQNSAVSLQAQASVTAALLRGIPRRLDSLLSGLEKGTAGVTLRALTDEPAQSFLQKITAEIVGTFMSIAAVVISVVLIVTDSGPVLSGGIRLFDLFGALIGFFGFLGVLRVLRQTAIRRRRQR
ncbi:ubiquinone biosynthesis protein [Microbacterium halimionae]|uniref:Ubiquinone biosynthesis protein n=1 Tax=Microbacterium halimionae TaxID=1526413 RepID=A0A7W3PLT4_9MICO|nr:AarF/UbiB family protein [Microbacterium halimionae]MBA8816326.1 ubiquinone biosynthesis protein [Microbacterium halimionae]NII96528.1 ubiquinone biosynthesis protein [Microbacterium halimionae]